MLSGHSSSSISEHPPPPRSADCTPTLDELHGSKIHAKVPNYTIETKLFERLFKKKKLIFLGPERRPLGDAVDGVTMAV